MLAKAEAERDEILRELEDKDKSILNLDEYVQNGLNLRDNMLKLWQIANLGHKRQLQNLAFPDGIVWNKETDDIEPLSKNEFLFTWGLKSGSYEEKENGQTDNFTDLSALASQNSEMLNLWQDFLKVVDFIDDNHECLNPLLAQTDKMKQ